MSKYRFSGMTCVYCLKEPSTPTGDHVFARKFFLADRRDNLPKVPACVRCNGKKAALELYLSAVLPLGANHKDAIPNAEMAEGRVRKNAKLHRELIAGITKELIEISPGVHGERLVMPFSMAPLHELFPFIVKALAWHHWNIELSPQFGVRVGSLPRAGEQFLAPLMELNVGNLVERNWGEGTFVYKGVQGTDYPEMTIWQFSVYGGFLVAEKNTFSGQSACIWAITAHESFLEKPAFRAVFEQTEKQAIGRSS
jgi:hypothetical protein